MRMTFDKRGARAAYRDAVGAAAWAHREACLQVVLERDLATTERKRAAEPPATARQVAYALDLLALRGCAGQVTPLHRERGLGTVLTAEHIDAGADVREVLEGLTMREASRLLTRLERTVTSDPEPVVFSPERTAAAILTWRH